jgi:hypothetical protein
MNSFFHRFPLFFAQTHTFSVTVEWQAFFMRSLRIFLRNSLIKCVLFTRILDKEYYTVFRFHREEVDNKIKIYGNGTQ